MIRVRLATEDDAEALLSIYAHYVKNTAVSYEYAVPSTEEFRGRIRKTLANYPYLVAEVDGRIAGYIYAGRFGERKAYDWSAASSIYIGEEYHRLGIGRLLYGKLESILRRQNVTNVYAGVAEPMAEDEYLTNNSRYFHEALGYRIVGRYTGCGNKFGRWYNLLWMEKIFDGRSDNPKPFIPFPELDITDEDL